MGCIFMCGQVAVTNHKKKNKSGTDYVEKTTHTKKAYPQIIDKEDLYDNSKDISSLESGGDKEENSSGFYNNDYTSDNNNNDYTSHDNDIEYTSDDNNSDYTADDGKAYYFN